MYKLFALLVAIGGVTASPWLDRMRLDKAEIQNEVCYEYYGCFSSEAPWTSALRPLVALPGRPEEVGTRFLLYTRNTRDEPEELMVDKEPLLYFSQFDENRDNVFVIHGWTDSGKTQWVNDTKNNMLDREDVNLFVVDWSPGASKNYLKTVGNARLVGAQCAAFIDFLERVTEFIAGRVHIVGHSLGAHIAGYIGSKIAGINRITALEPTHPYFEGTDTMVCLDKGDANYVEVIHTNTDGSIQFGLGVKEMIGHVDIYPNGGHAQPGCKDLLGNLVTSILQLITLDFEGAISAWACSHARVAEYWAQGVKNDCPFVAYPCADYSEFNKGNCHSQCQDGECALISVDNEKYFSTLTPGKYFLNTDNSKSYCLRPSQFAVTISAGQTKIDHGKITAVLRNPSGTKSTEFVIAQGEILASDNFSLNATIPSNFLVSTDDKLQVILHYTRTGLNPGLDPNTLSLDNLTINILTGDLQIIIKSFSGVTMDAGTDIIINEN